MSLMRAKVCGLTRAEDVAVARSAGADLIGFVHYPQSPRHCDALTTLAPLAGSAGVLVMVAEQPDDILQQLRQLPLTRVQPYLPDACRADGVRALQAAGYEVLLPWPDVPDQAPIPADLYIWETARAQTGVHGGSGQAHAAAHPPPGPYLLAGGMDADAIASRVAQLPTEDLKHLAGFDAASRLESSPGIKDAHRLNQFVSKVHDYAL
jgi:phosphoribosylanthranilate isomerase